MGLWATQIGFDSDNVQKAEWYQRLSVQESILVLMVIGGTNEIEWMVLESMVSCRKYNITPGTSKYELEVYKILLINKIKYVFQKRYL